MLTLLGWIGWAVQTFYMFTWLAWSLGLNQARPSRLHSILCELRMVLLVTTPFKMVGMSWSDSGWLRWFLIFCDLYWAWVAWHTKDDRWQRRRKRARARVRALAGRLVVVPAPETSGA